MRHGEGTLLHADGSIFRGRFYRDKKTGRGTVTSLDGSCYEGNRKVYRTAQKHVPHLHYIVFATGRGENPSDVGKKQDYEDLKFMFSYFLISG